MVWRVLVLNLTTQLVEPCKESGEGVSRNDLRGIFKSPECA